MTSSSEGSRHPQQQQQFTSEVVTSPLEDARVPTCPADHAIVVVHTGHGYQSVVVRTSDFQEALRHALAQILFRGIVIHDMRRLNIPRPGVGAEEAFASAPSVDWAQRMHQMAQGLAKSREFQQSIADRVAMLICSMDTADIERAQRRLSGARNETLPSNLEIWIDPLDNALRQAVLTSVATFLAIQS